MLAGNGLQVRRVLRYRAPTQLPVCCPSHEQPDFPRPLFSLRSYKPIVEYIDAQFEAYLQEELKIKRSLFNYHDTRIHACLYFIAPTGHSLKSLDLVTMKKLDSKVLAALLTSENERLSLSPAASSPRSRGCQLCSAASRGVVRCL